MAIRGHDGPMPAPVDTPTIPPLVCRDFTSWHLSGARFVGAYLACGDLWEVLHIGAGFQRAHGVHQSRAAAEVEAAALAVVLTTQATA